MLKLCFIYELANDFIISSKGQAPRALAKVSKSGVPARAVWISTAAAYVCAIFSFVSPDKLFLFLVNASGAIALIVYLAIAISHLRLRKKMIQANQPIKGMKMWLFPYLTYVTIAVITVIFLSMAFIDSMRSQFFLTLGLTAVVLLSYSFIKNK